jgi:hypothetical protein
MRWLAALVVVAGCDQLWGLTPFPDAKTDARPAPRCLGDTFEGTFDPDAWIVAAPSSLVALAVDAHHLVFTLAPSFAAYNALVSYGSYDLTGATLSVELVSPPTGWGAEAILTAQIDQGNGFTIAFSSDNLVAEYFLSGGVMKRVVPFAAEHHYWRIRHDAVANTVQFETSPDQVTWSAIAAGAPITPGYDITQLKIALAGGTFNSENPTPGNAVFDNIKLATHDCP